MRIIYGNQANKGGIYRILNMTNGRIYIGSTYRFKMRGSSHDKLLISKQHTNTFLQNDYNKCGADAFIFEILEVVDGDEKDRLAVEQIHIDKVYDNQKQCYNLEKIAGRTRRGKGNKNSCDPKTDKRCQPRTEEFKEQRRKTSSAYWNQPERRKFASERAKKKWANHKADITVRHVETGETVYVDKSLRKFCEERGLMYKAFHLLSIGHTKKSQGWVLLSAFFDEN